MHSCFLLPSRKPFHLILQRNSKPHPAGQSAIKLRIQHSNKPSILNAFEFLTSIKKILPSDSEKKFQTSPPGTIDHKTLKQTVNPQRIPVSNFHQENPSTDSMAASKWIHDVFSCFRGKETRNNFVSHLEYALSMANIKTFIEDKLPRGDTDSMAAPKWIHDVFLCFRGKDTRNNFVSHLEYALSKVNIKTFIDEKLPRGDNISSIFQAIGTSRIAIIVFSPNFASSTWCLDEVVQIIQCKASRGQLVLPVFFHVAPSDVRYQTGVFQLVFAKLSEDLRDDLQKVERWRPALREAANLAGWCIDSNVAEADFVQEIVKEVSSKLLKRSL